MIERVGSMLEKKNWSKGERKEGAHTRKRKTEEATNTPTLEPNAVRGISIDLNRKPVCGYAAYRFWS